MSVCTYEGEKRTKEREIVKNTRGKGQSITRKCGMGRCVSLCLRGVAHHSSWPL